MKSVTIVIPTYNSTRFIRETIESSIYQSYPLLRVLIIDDYSSDRTKDILTEYENKKNVEVIYNESNIGLTKTVNKALSFVDSDFYILLGHDDILPLNHVEIIMSSVKPDIDIVHCNSWIIDENGNKTSLARDDKKQRVKTDDPMFYLSLDNFISSCGMLVRTSLFNKVNGWNEEYLNYGEWMFYINSLSQGKLQYTDSTRAYYRKHTTNMSNTFKDRKVVRYLDEYKAQCRKLAKSKVKIRPSKLIPYAWNVVKLKIRKALF